MAFFIFNTLQAKYNPSLLSKIIQIAIFAFPKKIFFMIKAAKIIYTQTDEAPALATRSLLPIITP